MKKTIAIALLIFGAMSCSLKEKITSYTEGDKYYRSVEQIKTGLNACYSPLRLIYTNMGFWEMCECATDLMYLNIDNQIDAVCDIAPARPGAASLVWQRGYQGVSRTNSMIFSRTGQFPKAISMKMRPLLSMRKPQSFVHSTGIS